MGVCTAIMLGPTLVVGEIVPGNGSLTSQHPDLAKFNLQKRKLFRGHHMVQAAKRCCENQTRRFSGVYIYIYVFLLLISQNMLSHIGTSMITSYLDLLPGNLKKTHI